MAVSLAIMFGVGALIPSELAPMEDKSRLVINATAPEGTSFEAMRDYLGGIIRIVDTLPERDVIVSVTAPGFGGGGSTNSGFVRLNLVPPDERERSHRNWQICCRHGCAMRPSPSFVSQEQTISTAADGAAVAGSVCHSGSHHRAPQRGYPGIHGPGAE